MNNSTPQNTTKRIRNPRKVGMELVHKEYFSLQLEKLVMRKFLLIIILKKKKIQISSANHKLSQKVSPSFIMERKSLPFEFMHCPGVGIFYEETVGFL